MAWVSSSKGPDLGISKNVQILEMKMAKVGRSYTFDYGGFAVAVRYLSESKLVWEQIKGSDVGSKGEEEYRFSVIRPDVYLVWWQEKDMSVVTQVVDFERGRVDTIWVSPGKEVQSFQGVVSPRSS